jgi:hypothetical protein
VSLFLEIVLVPVEIWENPELSEAQGDKGPVVDCDDNLLAVISLGEQEIIFV